MFIGIYGKNPTKYINIYLNFVSFSKLENNPEVMVKKSLSVVEKLHFVWWVILF